MNDFISDIAPIVWPQGNRTGKLLHSILNTLPGVATFFFPRYILLSLVVFWIRVITRWDMRPCNFQRNKPGNNNGPSLLCSTDWGVNISSTMLLSRSNSAIPPCYYLLL